MKRNFFNLIVLLSFLLSCSMENSSTIESKINDLKDRNLKCKVKSIKETCFIAIENSGEFQKYERLDQSYIIFNNEGNISEENMYKSDGSLDMRVFYKYDTVGNKIEKNIYKPDGSLTWKWNYKYDAVGNKIEENSYKSGDTLKLKNIYKYDDYGNKIEGNSYMPNDSIVGKRTYLYDKNGNKIEENEYYKISNSIDGENQYTFDYSYNNLDEIIGSVHRSDDRLVWRWTFKYDSGGNRIERNDYNPNNNQLFKWTYRYDNHGNIIEEINEDPNDNSLYICNYKYIYDKFGNWTNRIKKDNQGSIRLSEREIEYY
jgi:YD repeat-containing protein